MLIVAFVVGIVYVFILLARRNEQQYEELDPDFLGAPVAEGTVTERKYLWREVNLMRKYRITYRVIPDRGREFTGWEVKWLGRDGRHKHFRPGAQHLVAYWPEGNQRVRALPPSQNPGWHHIVPRRKPSFLPRWLS